MPRVTRTTVGIVVLVAAAALGFAAFAFGGHGSGGGGDEHAGHTTTAPEAHPAAGHFAPDQTLLGSCAQGDQPCYEQAFGNLAYYEGPKNALVKFDDAIEANPDVRANCHRIVHMIGSASLQRYEGDVAKAFAGRLGLVLVRLLPRDPRALVRGREVSRRGEGDRARDLRRPGDREDDLPPLPVRPRARTRAHDLPRLRPALVARRVRLARDRLGPELVHGRRLHGEHLVELRDQVAVGPRRRRRLSPAGR